MPASVPVQNLSRHVQGALASLASLFGRSMPVMANSTVNQQLGVAAEQAALPTDKRVAKAWMLGLGGHAASAGTNGLSRLTNIPHFPNHTGLYYPVPWLIRDVGSDLSPTERQNYCFRVLMPNNKIGYYGRVFDPDTVPIQVQHVTVDEGEETVTAFTHSAQDNSPVRPSIGPGQTIATSADEVRILASVPFVMTTVMIEEFLEVISYLFDGDTVGYSTISEIGLVSGVSRVVVAADSVSYTELIDARIVATQAPMLNMASITTELSLTCQIGVVEPLLTVVTTP